MILDPKLFLFEKEALDSDDIAAIYAASMHLRSDILELIAEAHSGHIGGSYSTLDALLVTYLCANLSAENAQSPERDRVVISHGHVSALIYSLLSNMGYIDWEVLMREYRRVPGTYEGHPSIHACGIDWGSGSLGQGLSVGCGMAYSNMLKQGNSHTFVFMGDGENDKGQITEAMALAAKYKLGSLTAFIDYNGLQCTDCVDSVLPLNLKARYEAYGWNVFEVDGHDLSALYSAFRTAYHTKDKPCVIIGKTIMGKGIPFIENDKKYHGGFLNAQQLADARALFLPYRGIPFPKVEKKVPVSKSASAPVQHPNQRIVYSEPVACRTAFGAALADYASRLAECDRPIVIDCDVAPSTGMAAYAAQYPHRLIQCGIAEQNAVSIAGAMAACGDNVFFSTFASFALGEPYGQLRSNSMNRVPFKILTTHCGLDVGQDGKTHQCIDYIGLLANLYHFSLIIPADGNQADLAVRYLANLPEAGAVATGRSLLPIIRTEDDRIFYDKGYRFVYGSADWIRRGNNATIISYGTTLHSAVNAAYTLRSMDIHCGVMNISTPLALDVQKLTEAAKIGPIFVFEDHNVRSGLGVQIASFLMQNDLHCPLRCYGLSDYGGSAKASDLYHLYGLDETAMVSRVKDFFEQERNETL